MGKLILCLGLLFGLEYFGATGNVEAFNLNAIIRSVKEKVYSCLDSLGIIYAEPFNLDLLKQNIMEAKGSSLIEAIKRDDVATVKELISNSNTNINVKGVEDCTALHVAVLLKNLKMVQLLLNVPGIDVNAMERKGKTPLLIAVCEENPEIVKLLLTHPGIDVNATKPWLEAPLYMAVFHENPEIVRLLLTRSEIDVNVTDPLGLTPLHMAIIYKRLEIIKLLLARAEIDVNKPARSIGGIWMPLHMAVNSGNPEIVKLLLNAPGINVNATDNNGQTPLHKAVLLSSYAEHPELAQILLPANSEIEKLLLDTPSINIRAKSQNAMSERSLEIVRLLLNMPGINVNAKDKGDGHLCWSPIDSKQSGRNPLQLAMEQKEKYENEVRSLRQLEEAIARYDRQAKACQSIIEALQARGATE